MARALKHQKLVLLKIGLLEEQRNLLQTVVCATDKVLSLAKCWARNEDEESDATFEEINCMVEDLILFLGDTCEDLPDEFNGFEMFDVKKMLEAVSCLNIHPKKIQQTQPDKEEHSENGQYLGDCLPPGQKCVKKKKHTREPLTDKHKGTQNMIQAAIKAQANIEENNQLMQKIIKDQKENNDKYESQLEELTFKLDNVLDTVQVLGPRVGLLETNAVDYTQFSDLEMRCGILEENSENVRCKLDDLDGVIQELTCRVAEASNNPTSIPEFKQLQKAEEKINTFEEEWTKSKEEMGKLHDDFKTKNTILCKIIADRLVPLQKLRNIFCKQLNARKNNVKKLDTVCDQMADLLPKFLLHESKCENQFIGFIAHKSLHSQPIANSVVYFSEIIANYGEHFDIRTGTFSSPVDGLYAVSLNINGDKDVTVSLVKQSKGSFLKSLIANEDIILGKVKTTVNSFTASAFIVVDLKADDHLCVKYGPDELCSNKLGDSTFGCFRIGSVS